MNLPLLRLHLRRSLHPALGLLLVAVGLALLAGGPQVETVGLGEADPGQVGRGLHRAEAWAALALVLLGTLLARAARASRRWSAGEGLWASTGRLGPSGVAVSTWAGEALGLAVWLLLLTLGVEVLAGGGAPSWQAESLPEPVSGPVVDRPEGLAWSRDDGTSVAGQRLEVSWHWIGDYSPLTSARVVARRGAEERVGRARPQLAQRVEVELPAGSGPLELRLEPVGAERALAVDDLRTTSLRPASEPLGSWELALRLWAVGAVLLALVRGAGAFMEPGVALALVVVLGSLTLLESSSAWVPGSDLAEAFEVVSRGRVPRAPGLASWCAVPAWVVLGLALQVRAMRAGVAR